jgi:hypothetical protein
VRSQTLHDVDARLCDAYVECMDELERSFPEQFAALEPHVLAELHLARRGGRPSIGAVIDALSHRPHSPRLDRLSGKLEQALDELMPHVFVQLGVRLFADDPPGASFGDPRRQSR